MTGFMKTVLIWTQPPWDFPKKIRMQFQPINQERSVNRQPTCPACLCLAGWPPVAEAAGQGWPRLSCKENKHFDSLKSAWQQQGNYFLAGN